MTIRTEVRGKKLKRRQRYDPTIDQSLCCFAIRSALGWNDNNLHNSCNAYRRQRQQACGNCVEVHGCRVVLPANLLVFIVKNWKKIDKICVYAANRFTCGAVVCAGIRTSFLVQYLDA